MFGLQPTHIIIILFVALIIFGPRLLPELARAVGKSIAEFRNVARELQKPVQDIADDVREIGAPSK
ncbi:MAG: twin-arginine translocase TatA/TatE family subunit [Chloroflexi bacterium]|nr:twin-arginine translocase TatA/TatE family subunit [Chloroflexota bacterium]